MQTVMRSECRYVSKTLRCILPKFIFKAAATFDEMHVFIVTANPSTVLDPIRSAQFGHTWRIFPS